MTKLAILSLYAILLSGCGYTVVAQEPTGILKSGQSVLVDDGRCPAGQIMKVTGGDMIARNTPGVTARQHECIPRP